MVAAPPRQRSAPRVDRGRAGHRGGLGRRRWHRGAARPARSRAGLARSSGRRPADPTTCPPPTCRSDRLSRSPPRWCRAWSKLETGWAGSPRKAAGHHPVRRRPDPDQQPRRRRGQGAGRRTLRPGPALRCRPGSGRPGADWPGRWRSDHDGHLADGRVVPFTVIGTDPPVTSPWCALRVSRT